MATVLPTRETSPDRPVATIKAMPTVSTQGSASPHSPPANSPFRPGEEESRSGEGGASPGSPSQAEGSSPSPTRRMDLSAAMNVKSFAPPPAEPRTPMFLTERPPDASTSKLLNIFIFVNPTSGGNAAGQFTDSGLQFLQIMDPVPADVWIFDIREGESGDKEGFHKLKAQAVSASTSANGTGDKPVRVLVAGGDGTVLWCLTEMDKHGIPLDGVALGVIPYGTGNDFARALGWNRNEPVKPFCNRMQDFRALIQEWAGAAVQLHDVWEVKVDVHPESGMFQKIDSATRKKKALEGLPKSVTFLMSNYFSIGVESRIGIGFDRHRTKSTVLNKLRYVGEGLKKAFFKKTHKVNYFTSYMCEARDPNEEPEHLPVDDQCDTERNNICWTSRQKTSPASFNEHPHLLQTASLIAINIPSFASGMDIWAASNKTAFVPKTVDEKVTEGLLQARQEMGDTKLEFMSFPTAMSMGAEAAFKGNGRRVHQGEGPFRLVFAPLQRSTRVYFQVDGEFFIMNLPQTATIRRLRSVQVLRNTTVPRALGHHHHHQHRGDKTTTEEGSKRRHGRKGRKGKGKEEEDDNEGSVNSVSINSSVCDDNSSVCEDNGSARKDDGSVCDDTDPNNAFSGADKAD
eukprot:GHVU01055462.1.p1 GENE.GHVU01055462.1~~GHVU01055462.1.p1  ORF type:complete len:629 (+),score=103.36 GHVU01055462.1:236-2122(+)